VSKVSFVADGQKHPFTLRGLSDPTAWLASTDPYAQSFVTVSNDEVAAVVIKSSSFRDKFRKSIKSISHKLQIFGGSDRSRSRSIGHVDSTGTSTHTSTAPSTLTSQISLHGTPIEKPAKLGSSPRIPSEPFPMTSPPHPGSLSRRLSILGSRVHDSGQSPRRQTIQLASPPLDVPLTASEGSTRAAAAPTKQGDPSGVIVHRNTLVLSGHPGPAQPAQQLQEHPQAPRPITSSSSLDKLKLAADISPTSNLRRRQSSEINNRGRQRAPSDASSGPKNEIDRGFSGKLGRLLSRTSSQRSRFHKKDKAASASSDVDPSAIASPAISPAEAYPDIRPNDGLVSRSVETFDSGVHHLEPGLPLPGEIDGDRLGRLAWESRLHKGAPIRRGSSLSEDYTRGVEEEEVDWTEPLSDDDDYCDPSLKPALPHNASNLALARGWHQQDSDGLGLPLHDLSIAHPASAAPNLEPIPDDSPTGLVEHPAVTALEHHPLASTHSSPTSTTFPTEFGYRPLSRASERGSHSPFRSSPAPDRTRSPLGFAEDPKTSPLRLGLNRRPSSPLFENDDGDEGLAISIGSRRGRKESLLGRPSISGDR